MPQRKQQLLRQHRKNKRMLMGAFLLVTSAASVLLGWWLFPLGVLLMWVVHEAWLSDHIFYSPSADYQYRFPEALSPVALRIDNDTLPELQVDPNQTLILQIRLKSSFLGRFLDPKIFIGNDVQSFERGAKGVRYLNLTGQHETLKQGLSIKARYCSISADTQLWCFDAPGLANKRIMILAPHADDAELAAFGLYSAHADNTSIITLTQGEIEAEHYQRLALDRKEAARLKGRLRAWDSLAIPLWGGVKQQNCVQLGYYCLQLPAMREQPEQAFGSRESGEMDIRTVRANNPIALPADVNGIPNWNNLVADLVACLNHFQPDVVIMPHPELDPHFDHIATGQAFYEACAQAQKQPEMLLLYANHLHDNDRWPMGEANTGVALPPMMDALPADPLFSSVLSKEQQLDKAMALLMQHDLQPPLVFKKRLRRFIQSLLTGRRWPKTGENEFLRKAVRRHELFWVRKIKAD